MMKVIVLVVALALTLSELFAQQSVPEFSDDGRARSGYWAKWDFRAGELLYYRDIDVPSIPAVRIVRADGSTTPIYPLRDLPGASAVGIWDIAETPSGGVVISTIAEYAPRPTKQMPLKSLLLTYDRSGKLVKFWDIAPYHHHHLAVDGHGSVFALGTRNSTTSDFPLLIKYSPDGEEAGAFLPATFFPAGDTVVLSGSANGESEMFVDGEELVVWLAPIQELLRLSLDGELRARNSLENALNLLAIQSDSKRAKIVQISGLPNREIAAQVQLWPKDGSARTLALAIAGFSQDCSTAHFITPLMDSKHAGRFLGGAADGRLIFMERGTEPGQAAVIRKY